MADKTSIMHEAQKYLAKGQVDKAISEWEKLVHEYPDGNTYNVIGDLYLKKGDKKGAVDSFHKAASFFRAEGFMLKALALYKKVLNINNSDFEALYALGQLSEEKGLATDAIKYYLAAADGQSKEGKKDRLLEIYEKILSLSPSNIPLRNKVAEIFLKEGLKSSATKEYLVIAGLYDEKGDAEKSVEYFRKVADIQPLNRDAVLGIGYVYEKTGKMAEALGHMREATVLFHTDSEILLRYSELCLKAGRREEAVAGVEKVREQDPGNTRAAMLLGDIFLDAGQKDKAWTEYLPVIDDMIMREKYEDAVRVLEDFREIDPLECGKRLVSLHRQLGHDTPVSAELVNLGDALRQRDLVEEALNCYREALGITPEEPGIRSRINELEAPRTPEPVVPEEAPETQVFPDGLPGEEEEQTGDPHQAKTVAEVLTEADILCRYGLPGEAIKLLETVKLRDPRNIDLHLKLMALYREVSDTESATTECLVLSELFKRAGDDESSAKMLKEAFELSPEDPRLAGRGPNASSGPEIEPVVGAAQTGADLADYAEEIAEADFYHRQGLVQEAFQILDKLHNLFPENAEIREKLESLGQSQEEAKGQEYSRVGEPDPQEEADSDRAAVSGNDLKQEEVLGNNGFEDLSITDEDLVDAQEMPEPALDNDVLEIFHEFKKGLEKELGDQDSETHYNLGIAYKEMGLIDDAIKEFQSASEDPKKAVPSSTMLGVCYMEKGLFSLAVQILEKAIAGMDKGHESYWPISYDLAEAYEKSDREKEALDLYTQVFGWNAQFRNVSDKISRLKTASENTAGQEPKRDKIKSRKDRVSYL